MKAVIIYFSRAGEQYGVGTVQKGNTAIVAHMISNILNIPLFELKLKNDTYPTTYKALTNVALIEKKQNMRPELAADLNNFDEYDTVFIGSPNWWGDLPMIFYTFFEKHDFSHKTVIPFITHEGSGFEGIDQKIRKTIYPQKMLNGFEILGSVAQNQQKETKSAVENWLKSIGF